MNSEPAAANPNTDQRISIRARFPRGTSPARSAFLSTPAGERETAARTTRVVPVGHPHSGASDLQARAAQWRATAHSRRGHPPMPRGRPTGAPGHPDTGPKRRRSKNGAVAIPGLRSHAVLSLARRHLSRPATAAWRSAPVIGPRSDCSSAGEPPGVRHRPQRERSDPRPAPGCGAAGRNPALRGPGCREVSPDPEGSVVVKPTDDSPAGWRPEPASPPPARAASTAGPRAALPTEATSPAGTGPNRTAPAETTSNLRPRLAARTARSDRRPRGRPVGGGN